MADAQDIIDAKKVFGVKRNCNKFVEESLSSGNKRPRKRRKKDDNSEEISFVSIKLYGKLAQMWIGERGTMTDEIFIKYLLKTHELNKQQFLNRLCKQASSPTAVDDMDERDIEIDELYTPGETFVQSLTEVQDAPSVVNVEIEQSDESEVDEEAKMSDSVPYAEPVMIKHVASDAGTKQPDELICDICGKKMKKGELKQSHLLAEHFILYIKCKLCVSDIGADDIPENLVKVKDFYQHINSVHNICDHTCPFCEKSVPPNNLCGHVIEQHWKKLLCQCLICEPNVTEINDVKSILKAISVRGHVIKRHPVAMPARVPCEICGIKILSSGIVRHMKIVHENSKEICDLCGKTFADVDRHKTRVHNDKKLKFECNVCKRVLTSRWNLNVHSRIHTGEKPFVCEICGKAFCQNVELRLHVKNNHEKIPRKSRKTKKDKVNPLELRMKNQNVIEKSNKEMAGQAPKSLDNTSNVSVATSTENLLQTVGSQSSLPSTQKVYAVIPAEECHNVLLTPVSTEANVGQSVTVLNVNAEDIKLGHRQMVWITPDTRRPGDKRIL